MVLLFIAFYTAPFSSKHFVLGLFIRSLSTQLFFLVLSEHFARRGSVDLLAFFLFFFSSVLFSGLPIFSVSVLNNFQGRLHIISSFWGGCAYSFVSLLILLISAILRDYFSQDFSCVFYRAFFFLVLFYLAGLHCLLRMHAPV